MLPSELIYVLTNHRLDFKELKYPYWQRDLLHRMALVEAGTRQHLDPLEYAPT